MNTIIIIFSVFYYLFIYLFIIFKKIRNNNLNFKQKLRAWMNIVKKMRKKLQFANNRVVVGEKIGFGGMLNLTR